MKGLHEAKAWIEKGFERYGHWIAAHAGRMLLVITLVVGLLASRIPGLAFDTSTESFFHPNDPVLIAYETFREQFGRDEMVIIAVEPPEVFNRNFLRKLVAFHQALESEVPHLREVTSLVNARNTRGEGDSLIVEDLLDTFPDSPEALDALKRRVMSGPLYRNFLISEDGRFTTVVIETDAFTLEEAPGGPLESATWVDEAKAALQPQGEGEAILATRQPLTDLENSELVASIRGVIDRFDSEDFRLHLTGSPVVTDILKRAMQSNMQRFIALALLSIGAFLFLLFRRVSGMAIPLVVVLASVASTLSLLVLTGTTFKLMLMVLPSFLLAVGVGASVHLLAIFFRHYEAMGDKTEALAHALGHSGLPIVMTSLTTAAGLFSFVTAALAPVGDLGLFAGLGVAISLVLTLTLAPSLLALLPIRRHSRWQRANTTPWADRILIRLARFGTGHAKGILVLSAVLLVFATAGLFQLRFSHNTLTWFPTSTEIRRTTDLIDTNLKGSVTLELVVDTGAENGLYDPEVLKGMEHLATYAQDYRDARGKEFVSKTNSLVDVVKEIHQALNANEPGSYMIPENRALIAQELLLFENSGINDLKRLVDASFSRARITLKTPWEDASSYVEFVDQMTREADKTFAGRAEVSITGLIRLLTQSIDALMTSMVTSYAIAAAVITVLMILLIGRFRLGLLSMIPNLMPIVLTLGLMGWTGIPLDAFTLLIGSIALGLAVDDTIHFFHNYIKVRESTGSMQTGVEETLLTTGRAMLFTTLVLATGFWLFMFATLNNLFYFGLLTGTALVLALISDLLVAPALLKVFHRT